VEELQSPQISAEMSSKLARKMENMARVAITVVARDTLGEECTTFKHSGTRRRAG
jgi:hypothetical protein